MLKHRKKFYIASIVFTIAGIIVLSVFKLNLGIDFSCGTRVEIHSDTTLTQEVVAEKIEKIGLPSDDIVISGENKESAVVRYKEDFTQEEIKTLKSEMTEQFGVEPSVSTVLSTVGKELAKNAIICIDVCGSRNCYLCSIPF